MNKNLRDSVSNCAFSLNLSKRMVRVLIGEVLERDLDESLRLETYKALERRGLAYWDEGGFEINDDGRRVYELLESAGYVEDYKK